LSFLPEENLLPPNKLPPGTGDFPPKSPPLEGAAGAGAKNIAIEKSGKK